jgi:hypothetical protein
MNDIERGTYKGPRQWTGAVPTEQEKMECVYRFVSVTSSILFCVAFICWFILFFVVRDRHTLCGTFDPLKWIEMTDFCKQTRDIEIAKFAMGWLSLGSGGLCVFAYSYIYHKETACREAACVVLFHPITLFIMFYIPACVLFGIWKFQVYV